MQRAEKPPLMQRPLFDWKRDLLIQCSYQYGMENTNGGRHRNRGTKKENHPGQEQGGAGRTKKAAGETVGQLEIVFPVLILSCLRGFAVDDVAGAAV